MAPLPRHNNRPPGRRITRERFSWKRPERSLFTWPRSCTFCSCRGCPIPELFINRPRDFLVAFHETHRAQEWPHSAPKPEVLFLWTLKIGRKSFMARWILEDHLMSSTPIFNGNFDYSLLIARVTGRVVDLGKHFFKNKLPWAPNQ